MDIIHIGRKLMCKAKYIRADNYSVLGVEVGFPCAVTLQMSTNCVLHLSCL